MRLHRKLVLQLGAVAAITVVAVSVMMFEYLKVPAMLGFGRYGLTVELPRSGGLYERGNVTYRGTQVGKIRSVELKNDGTTRAVLSMDSDVQIPSNVLAEVHSQSAVGEQYIALLPQDGTSPSLKNGDVIPLGKTSVPPDVDKLLDATNRGLQAIPQGNLKTVIDESYTAIGGMGPELSRIVKGSSALATDARANLDSLTMLIDGVRPLLDTQTATGDSVRGWAKHLADISEQLRANDSSVAGLIDNGGQAAEQADQLVERLQPTLPVLLANLVTVGKVAISYQPAVEQLLVLIPQVVAFTAGATVPNRGNNGPYAGAFLDFKLNLNLPPPCTTGFLPATQRRTAVQTDAPERPKGALYCRTPQDGQFNVRGAKNLPCLEKPGKRGPTVAVCDGEEQYVPLNDGMNWKGDPNATLSGQDIPQLPAPSAAAPGTAPQSASPASAAPPPLTVAPYDPATGSYIGPDGKVYTQTDLGADAPKEKTWQDMVSPP